ncbi:S1 RNA-binding domain-containing protein, partial [Marinimicrobium sp. UBA4509]
VTNVTNFGAFIDIGVHQDGLVHISALSNTFVKDPREVVKAGDVVKVKVMEVDVPRKRIGLSMRLDDEPGEKTDGPKGGPRRAPKSNGGQNRQGNRGGQGAGMGSMGALLQEALKKK